MIAGFPSSLQALTVIPNNYKELAAQAESIVDGICLSKVAATIRDPKSGMDIPVVRYTFQIQEVLSGSGEVGSIVQITELGGTRQERAPLGIQYMYAPPELQVHQEYLIFFGKETELGLRLIAGGVGEGIFKIIADATGTKRAVNFFNNQGLIPENAAKSSVGKGMDKSAGGVLPYEAFKQLIKESK